MRLPILQQTENDDLKSFVEFWSKGYYYPLEDLYNNRIHKEQYNESDIQEFFIWKNGMNLSKLKQKSLNDKIISKTDLINKYKRIDDIDIDCFNLDFNNVSAVWRIFLLHIIKPTRFPIYDQHINRAFNYIHGLDYNNISSTMSNKKKEVFYFGTYLNFISSLDNFNLKELDEAFFAFGQFINTNNYINLIK